MPNYNLKDKVVIVTGSSAGLGAACAEAFAAEGSRLVITGQNETRLKEITEKCLAIGLPVSNILTLKVDHAKDEENDRVVSETIAKFGQLDVLVNNAGILRLHSAESCSKEEYDLTMGINVRAPFRLIQQAIPHLRKTKGNIVNVSSIGGMKGSTGSIAYAMAKAALDNLTRSSCLELAPDGIRVNSVNPGYFPTNIMQAAGIPKTTRDEFEEERLQKHPLKRHGRPEELADAVLYLASDKASFITGVILPVDGGRMAACP